MTNFLKESLEYIAGIWEISDDLRRAMQPTYVDCTACVRFSPQFVGPDDTVLVTATKP